MPSSKRQQQQQQQNEEEQESSSSSSLSSSLSYLSLWDEDETKSPLMRQQQQQHNHNRHSSSSSLSSRGSLVYGNSSSNNNSRSTFNTYAYGRSQSQSPATYSSPVRPNNIRKRRSSCGVYELKNAHDALVGSISAVIDFLRMSGIPKPSCDQLQKNLDLGRYFAVLKRVQDYIQCIPRSQSEDETLAKIHLAVTAWEALWRMKSIEHKQAYKHGFSLRGYDQEPFGGDGKNNNNRSSSHSRGYSKHNNTEIQKAIALQVKLAEQCTAVQKKLYMVQKWQRHLLHQMRRSTVIEPQGHKPIRCL